MITKMPRIAYEPTIKRSSPHSQSAALLCRLKKDSGCSRRLANSLNLHKVVVGTVFVASVTSAPELFSSLFAAVFSSSQMAFGNIMGLNIYNVPLIIGTITTGEWSQSICSSKIVTPIGYDENRSIENSIINGNRTLRLICANISSGWHIWAGILIQNDGTIPTSVKEPIIEVVGADIQDFTINIYYYGPYDRGDFGEVWGKVEIENLPFKNSKKAGEIILEPNQKAVIWIEFSYEKSAAIDETTIYITIQYNIS